MELNFDKEMDALLRQTARQDINAPSAADVHLDADELSAFAANALPVAARSRAVGHLADCSSCRTILSNLVFFEEAREEEPAVVPLVKIVASKDSLLDRIKGFFALPVLAYGMGALVLMFSGLFVVVMLNSRSGSDMAASNTSPLEKPVMSKAADESDTVQQAPAAAANSNSVANFTGNLAQAANTASTGALAPGQSLATPNTGASGPAPMDFASSVANTAKEKGGEDAAVKAERQESLELKSAAPAPPPPVAAVRSNDQAEPRVLDEEYLARSRNNSRDMRPDGAPQNMQNMPKKSAAPNTMGGASRESRNSDNDKAAAPAKVAMRGKEFRREGSVWIDSAYRGGAVTNIARGSKEFKKLDGDIKKTANDLGGAVIIVWKSVAYRIQ